MKNGSWEMLPLLCIDPTNAGLTSLDNGEWGIKDNKDDDDNDGGKDDGENGGSTDDSEDGGKDESENGGNVQYSDGDENYYKG